MTWAARIPTLAGLRYPQASFVLDFASNYYRGSGAQGSSPSALPGYNFTRALAAYAEDTAGNLIQFASGVPRITNKGVLIEESRANLLLRSQAFNTSPWTKGGTTSITENSALAPDGTVTGAAVSFPAINDNVLQPVSVSASTGPWTFSVWLKGVAGQTCRIVVDGTLSGSGYEAATLAVTLTSNWVRYSITTSFSTNKNSLQAYVQRITGQTATSLNAWGAQLEAGSFATSYIPTTSASVTRPADVFYYSGLSANPSGTVAATFIPSVFSAYRRIVSGPSGGNFVSNILFENSTSGKVQSYDASNLGITSNAAALNSINNAAMRYTGSAAGISLNGGGVATAVGGADFSTQTSYYIGNTNAAATNWLNGYIQRLAIYPFAASDAQLQSISSGNF